jgi:hypothetical protein
MEFKYVENIDNLSDKSIVTIRKAIQRRLDKAIDKNDITVMLITRLEVLNLEIEKRGLSL